MWNQGGLFLSDFYVCCNIWDVPDTALTILPVWHHTVVVVNDRLWITHACWKPLYLASVIAKRYLDFMPRHHLHYMATDMSIQHSEWYSVIQETHVFLLRDKSTCRLFSRDVVFWHSDKFLDEKFRWMTQCTLSCGQLPWALLRWIGSSHTVTVDDVNKINFSFGIYTHSWSLSRGYAFVSKFEGGLVSSPVRTSVHPCFLFTILII